MLIKKIMGIHVENEIQLIRRACEISSEAMLDAMVASRQNPDENYIASIFEFGCATRGKFSMT